MIDLGIHCIYISLLLFAAFYRMKVHYLESASHGQRVESTERLGNGLLQLNTDFQETIFSLTNYKITEKSCTQFLELAKLIKTVCEARSPTRRYQESATYETGKLMPILGTVIAYYLFVFVLIANLSAFMVPHANAYILRLWPCRCFRVHIGPNGGTWVRLFRRNRQEATFLLPVCKQLLRTFARFISESFFRYTLFL